MGVNNLENRFGVGQAEVLPLLKELAAYLSGRGITAYIVGGWVRDVLAGRKTADVDIAVDGDSLEVAKDAAAAFGGKYALLDNENRVGRVALPEGKVELDFSTLRGNLEQDLGLRDFTIDAMAVELSRAEDAFRGAPVIDPYGGQADLENRILRAVTDSVFTEDPGRLLRGARLAAGFGFRIDEKTEKLIKSQSQLVSGVAGERTREELLRLLSLPESGRELFYLDELGLLTAVFPELEEARGVEQPGEHHWDVFQHSLRTVVAVDFLLDEGEWEHADKEDRDIVHNCGLPENYFEEEVGYGSTRKSLLRLAALLHDVSKPACRTLEENGRIRFLGHADEGAEVAIERLEKLRFSAREIRLVEAMVRHHMRPTQMSNSGLPGNRAIYRFFRDTGDAAYGILFLSLADHLAARGPDLIQESWREHAELVCYVIKQRLEKEKLVIPPKLVSGYDIMDFPEVSGGPQVGEILEAVREAQAAGEVVDREGALDFVRKWLGASGKQSRNT